MKARRVIIMSIALYALAIFWMVRNSSTVRASANADKDNIVALNQRLVDSFNKQDLAGIMSCYMKGEDLVFFEDTTPLQLGAQELSTSICETSSMVPVGFMPKWKQSLLWSAVI